MQLHLERFLSKSLIAAQKHPLKQANKKQKQRGLENFFNQVCNDLVCF